MIAKVSCSEMQPYIDQVYAWSLDLHHSIYPAYSDGLKTKDDFIRFVNKPSTDDEKNENYLIMDHGHVSGWIHCYVQDSEKYCHIDACSIEEGEQNPIHAFVEMLKGSIQGYQCDIGMSIKNQDIIHALTADGFHRIEHSFVNIISFDHYTEQKESGDIVPVTKENEEQFKKIHAQCEGSMYWNNERLFDEYNTTNNRWHLYMLMKEQNVSAVIYFIFVRGYMEVFGIDFENREFDEDEAAALIIKALNISKDAGIKGTFYWADNEQEEKMLQKIGYDCIDTYEAYQMIL